MNAHECTELADKLKIICGGSLCGQVSALKFFDIL